MNNRFWGGVGIDGGFTVHMTLVPDISTFVKKGVQDNADIGALTGKGLLENGLELRRVSMGSMDSRTSIHSL